MRLTVRNLIVMLIVIFVALWLGLRVYQQGSIDAIQDSLELLTYEASKDVEAISELQSTLNDYTAKWQKCLADQHDPRLERELSADRERFEAILKAAGELRAGQNPTIGSGLTLTAKETDRLSKLYFEATQSVLKGRMMTTGLEEQIQGYGSQLQEKIGALQAFYEEAERESSRQSASIIKTFRTKDLIFLLTSLTGLVLLSLLVWSALGSPLLQLSRGMHLIQNNQWKEPLEKKGFGEAADLINNFNDMAKTLIEQRDRLHQQATTDELTGLLNFRSFQQRTEEELARARRTGHPVTLILADIDHFKRFNDTRGHLAGNEALKSVARHLQDGCRPYDIIARFGGEEMAVVLPEATKGDGAKVAERVRGRAAQEGPVTLSCGVATFPEDAHDLQTLIAKADQRLYEAKESGRNRVCA